MITPATNPALRLPVLLHQIHYREGNHGECPTDHGAADILAALEADGWDVVLARPHPASDPTVCELCGALADGEPGRCHLHFRSASTSFHWLIERGQAEGQVPTVWWSLAKTWTTDANEALQFPTQADAERYIEEHSPIPSHRDRFGRASQHGFLSRD